MSPGQPVIDGGSLDAFLGSPVVTSDGQLTIEIIGGSGGEVWDIERSTDLVSWEPVEKVVLEIENGFASAMLTLSELDGEVALFRARRGSLQDN